MPTLVLFAFDRFGLKSLNNIYLSKGFRPEKSSNITTPKLYTSLLVVHFPDIAASGAPYPDSIL